MAEVNDLFIRSLRKSTSRRPSGGVEVGLAAGLSKHQAASWLTGRQSASGQSRPATGCGKSEDIRGDEMPPDLLANLTPRPQSGSPPFSRSDASEGGLTERILGRKAWNPFCNSVKKSTSAGLTPVVKEYRVQEQTARSRAGSTPLANHSALIQSQVRVVPTWFPPTNISRLKRQDSFHGETAASKQRAFRMECRTQREPSVPAETDSLSCTQMITQEPGMTAAASTPGKPDLNRIGFFLDGTFVDGFDGLNILSVSVGIFNVTTRSIFSTPPYRPFNFFPISRIFFAISPRTPNYN
jgi:hypothetical protein